MEEDFYTPSLMASLLASGTQAPTTAQPEPYVLDLGDWAPADLSGLQNLFFPNGLPPVNGTPEEIAAWQAANARTPEQFYDDLRASKAAETVSMNPYSNSGLDAINYNIWNAMMPQETGQVFRFDTGNDIGVPDGSGGWTYRNAGQVVWTPGTEYTMYDKTGKVLGKASTPEEMDKLVTLSEKSPFYTLEKTADPNPSIQLGGMMPSKTDAGSLGSMLVNMAALALPAVGGAALGPVLAGSLGTSAAVGTGLGTAIGTAAAGTAAGKSIEDILLQSALAGIAAGGLSAITRAEGVPDVGDLQAQVIDGTMSLSQATNALTKAGASAADVAKFAADVGGVASSAAFPTVIGNVGGAAVGGAAGSAVGGITGAGLGALTGVLPQLSPRPQENQIDVIADYNANVPPLYSPTVPFDIAFRPEFFQPPVAEQPIVVEAAQPTTPPEQTIPTVLPPTTDIVVQAPSPTPPPEQPAPPPVVVPPTGVLPPTTDIVVQAPSPTPPPEQPAPPPVVVPPTGVLPPTTDIVVQAPSPTPPPEQPAPPPVVVPPTGVLPPTTDIVVQAPSPTPPPEQPAPPPVVVPPTGVLPPTTDIVVQAPSPTPPPEQPAPPPVVVPPTGVLPPTTDIVVQAPSPTPPPEQPQTPVALPDIVTPITSVPIPPNAGLELPSTNDSLLRDIMRYYSLGSGLLDLLGVGKGGGAGGTTSPYTSLLGPAPTFTRGPFTPFTGDYETYAQGPEWNFFGGNQPNG